MLSFARMSANAYYEGVNRTGWKWKDISPGYNYTLDFGWEEDGLRGHVFVDGKNESLVVALKGMIFHPQLITSRGHDAIDCR